MDGGELRKQNNVDSNQLCKTRDQEDNDLRVKEVLKEPGAEDRDGALRKAALRPPHLLLLEHANLLEGTLVAQPLVQDTETRGLTLVENGDARELLAQCSAHLMNVVPYCIP